MKKALIAGGVVLAVVGAGAAVGTNRYVAWTHEPEQVFVSHVKAAADVGSNTGKTLVQGGRSVCLIYAGGGTRADVHKAMRQQEVPADLAAAVSRYALQDLCPQHRPKASGE